jgi:hypothetical protein
MAVVFVACFEQLNSNFNPMINAVAEIQAHLSKGRKGKIVPLFEMKAVGYIQTLEMYILKSIRIFYRKTNLKKIRVDRIFLGKGRPEP